MSSTIAGQREGRKYPLFEHPPQKLIVKPASETEPSFLKRASLLPLLSAVLAGLVINPCIHGGSHVVRLGIHVEVCGISARLCPRILNLSHVDRGTG